MPTSLQDRETEESGNKYQQAWEGSSPLKKVDKAEAAAQKYGGAAGDPSADPSANPLGNMQAGIAGVGEKLGKGFTGNIAGVAGAAGAATGFSRLLASAGQHKKGLLAGGIGGGITTALIVMLLSTLPFGFKSIMNAMISKSFKVDHESLAMMEENFENAYIKHHLLPGMKLKGCTSTIVDRNCVAAIEGDSLPARRMRAMQKAAIENIWARGDNGVEFRYDRASNRYFVRSTVVGEVDITRFADTEGNLWQEIGRSEMRAAMRQANNNATHWERFLIRFGWSRSVMKDQYGIDRCVIACNKNDKFTDSFIDKKNAYRIKFAQRVLYPRSRIMGLAFTCLFSGSKCDPNEPDIDAQTGEYSTKFEEEIQGEIQKILAETGGDETLQGAQKILEEMRTKGWEKYVVEGIIKSLLGKAGASEAASASTATFATTAVPYVGLFNSFAAAISILATGGEPIKALVATTQKDSMVRQFGMNATYADEISSGVVDSAEVSSFAASFAPGQQIMADGSSGGAGAGATPLYNAVVNDGDQTVTTAFNGFFGTASADESAADPSKVKVYYCPLAKDTVPAGKLICDEQTLNFASFITKTFGSISNFLNSPGINIVTSVAEFWHTTGVDIANVITKPIVDLIQHAPGYASLQQLVADGADSILKSFADNIVPNWINDHMNGGDNFIGSFGGSTAVANDYAERQLGGQPLTLEQRAAIESQAYAMDAEIFQQKPLVARLFDKEDDHSLVTRLSLAMPLDFKSNMASMFTDLMSNPFGKIFHSFGAVFSTKTAFAAPTVVDDPYGFIHYGVPLDNAVYTTDPMVYWSINCNETAARSKAWNDSVRVDPNTGLAGHTQADPCRLVEESSKIGGAIFDSSLVGK